MPSLYKIFAMILADRLKEEMEEKSILPENQAAERNGNNQIYTLNYLINKQLKKERRGMVALFMDLKAAFDSVNREILIKSIGKGKERKGEKEGKEYKRGFDGENRRDFKGNEMQGKDSESVGRSILDGKESKTGMLAEPHAV